GRTTRRTTSRYRTGCPGTARPPGLRARRRGPRGRGGPQRPGPARRLDPGQGRVPPRQLPRVHPRYRPGRAALRLHLPLGRVPDGPARPVQARRPRRPPPGARGPGPLGRRPLAPPRPRPGPRHPPAARRHGPPPPQLPGRRGRLTRRPGGGGPAAVGAGDDLQEVAARLLPVDPAAAVVGVDLARPPPAGVGAVGQPALPDAAEDLVELVLADQERIVLGVRRPVVVGEVQ